MSSAPTPENRPGPDPRYPVVLFDLDNTLSDFSSAQRAALPAVLEQHGVDASGEAGQEYLSSFKRLAAPLWEQLELGELTLATLNDERFRRFVDHHGLDVAPNVLASAYLPILGVSGDLMPGAIDLLEILHGQVRMGMITNGYSEVQRPRIERFGLGKYFEGITVSGEIGHAKPGRAFFDVALDQLGNPDPASVLVVGDSLSSDIAGGVTAGCFTCWFNPDGQPVPDDDEQRRVDHVAVTLAEVATVVLGG